MNSAKHSYNLEHPRHDSYPPVVNQHPTTHESIVPGYMRENVYRAMGQRIVRDAVKHRSIELKTFSPQETIFPNFDNLDQAPQTD